ncbi:MAG: hypothetical protein ACLR76_08345 [Alistipes sp.]
MKSIISFSICWRVHPSVPTAVRACGQSLRTSASMSATVPTRLWTK